MWNFSMPMMPTSTSHSWMLGYTPYNPGNYNMPIWNMSYSNRTRFMMPTTFGTIGRFNYDVRSFIPPSSGSGGGSGEISPATDANTKLDNIRSMKYDNSSLKSKLDEITNPNDVSNYLTSKGKLVNTIDSDDGGHVYIYEDSNGNPIGSISKDKDGNIRNVSLDIADGSSISINTNDGNTISSKCIMSKHNEENKNVGTNYTTMVSNLLNGEFKGISPKTERRSDGTTSVTYAQNDGRYLQIIKDKSGKITDIIYASENTAAKQTLHMLTDKDGDGKIDAGEQTVRYDMKA